MVDDCTVRDQTDGRVFQAQDNLCEELIHGQASLNIFFDSSPDPFFVPPIILFVVWLLGLITRTGTLLIFSGDVHSLGDSKDTIDIEEQRKSI